MKNAELKLHIIEVLEPVVARVEALVESENAPDAETVALLKNDLRALYDAICEVERTEVQQPENPVLRMRNSVSELKRKLMLVSKEEEPAPMEEEPEPVSVVGEPEPVFEEPVRPEPEFSPVV